jgi:hypothetical protein
MLKLVEEQVQSEVSFELENTPGFAGFDVIFSRSQDLEQKISTLRASTLKKS